MRSAPRWGRALLAAIDRVGEPGRLARGRAVVRGGQVLSWRAEPGVVVGEVQGSQPRPFTAALVVRRLREEELELLVEEIRATPGTLAEVVAGAPPASLEPLLLPDTAADLDFDCTCPDSARPCRHVAAVCHVFADRLDEHPRDLLTVRGVDPDTLIGAVERERENEDPAADPYGEGLELPALPRPAPRPALNDLDPVLLRRALRSTAADEAVAAAGWKDLAALYRALEE
ncbi:SWIM zinc finger family protein [Nocardia sp. NPDC057353]|uniref:SWIM zinc finger family protein n=1 Tax=Nocardia sp. NPDC057353 TaxID=3346104 RepID=UPI00362D93C8